MVRLERRRKFDLFDDIFDGIFKTEDRVLIKTDIKEKEDKYEIIMDVPGIEKEQIEVTLDKGYLCVTINNVSESVDEDEYYIRKERLRQSASRKFYVGNYLMEEDIAASLDKGVLVLEVPKETEKTAIKKTIEIK